MSVKPKKLIEVAMPVKEVSAESVYDKYIHHGHISTLHIWWARRPLPVCRAVVFASLVPDPLDPNCPTVFKNTVDFLLGKDNQPVGDPYKPYQDIPHTAVMDKMEDNSRNRLLMFIGKFSDKYVSDQKLGKKTPAKDTLSDASLVKWDSKNDERIIGLARTLIFVSHNANSNSDYKILLKECLRLSKNVKNAESDLYNLEDRHLYTEQSKQLEESLENAKAAFLAKMPKVFDPFAGGGAIPLEAARLGCNSYGNDINPVAHIIQKGSCEFPQRYGKPITYSVEQFREKYDITELEKQRALGNVFGDDVKIDNRLSLDVQFYAHLILARVEEKIGYLYPKNEDGDRPIAYYWARTAFCQNPSCGAEVPLIRSFFLAKKKNKSVCLIPIFDDTKISFTISKKKTYSEKWINRGNLKCPCCEQITDVKEVKRQSRENGLNKRLIAVIYNGVNGKDYRLPTSIELNTLKEIKVLNSIIPTENMQRNSAGGDTFSWGVKKWGQLFLDRQVISLQSFIEEINILKKELSNDHYSKALITYLSIWIDRIASYNTSFGRWIPQNEQLTSIFGRQAIPMVTDFPEMQPFALSTSAALNQLDWILMYLNSESGNSFASNCQNASSGDKNQFKPNELVAVITDPPYYDAIAYADLSDFFYVWLKRSLGDIYPLNFATPQTPKGQECTALKHHHNNDLELAYSHFENKLTSIFQSLEMQTSDIISIMFAHQSTKAWTTLCNSILSSNLNINSSWAIDSERDTRMIALAGDALQSSITVSCVPSTKKGIGSYKEIKEVILELVILEVQNLYNLGFRGADLLTACFGKAVSVFGRYERVEKADGSEVTVAELLDMAKEAAFNAIISDIDTDEETKFYIGWLNLHGFANAENDTVRRIAQTGLHINYDEIYNHHLIIKTKDEAHLGDMASRIKLNEKLGKNVSDKDIDKTHRMMYLFDPKTGTRNQLIDFVGRMAPNAEHRIWRVLNSLIELLPKGGFKDFDLAQGLLINKENLIRDAKNRPDAFVEQGKFDL